jgi:hypothetical protein
VLEDNEGDWVCMIGANSGTPRCGSVTAVYVSTNVAGVDYIAQRRATFSAVGGDSGGPVYISNTAIGIFSAFGSGSSKYYSHVGYVDDMLNVIPCFDSRCGDGGT